MCFFGLVSKNLFFFRVLQCLLHARMLASRRPSGGSSMLAAAWKSCWFARHGFGAGHLPMAIIYGTWKTGKEGSNFSLFRNLSAMVFLFAFLARQLQKRPCVRRP